jgi:glycosyltransferase involved in cell wall biosynthesis
VSEVPPQAWSRIDISAWQPPAAVVGELLRAKVGLVLLHPQPNHGDPVRSRKLFEYMAAGIPVVACDLPRWRALVERVGCGLVVDPRDPRAVAAAIEHLLRNPGEAEAMGERGRAVVEAEFNWDMQAPKLRSFYADLTNGR